MDGFEDDRRDVYDDNNNDGGVKKKKKKKKKKRNKLAEEAADDALKHADSGVAALDVLEGDAAAKATAKGKGGYDQGKGMGYDGNHDEDEYARDRNRKEYEHDRGSMKAGEMDKAASTKIMKEAMNDEYGVIDASAAYYPNVEADSEAMAAVAAQGNVDVDDAGGITAFVADHIIIGDDAVGVIRSDDEVEKEEKKKYTKRFAAFVCCIVITILVIAVPLTLKFTNTNKEVRVIITEEPTSAPSLLPSSQPSAPPTTERFTMVIDKLIPLSGEGPLKTVGSPQNRAARWISDYDQMNMELNEPGFEQRYVMALFYYAMDGQNWKESYGWLSADPVCFWFGIEGSSPGCSQGCTLQLNEEDYQRVCRIKFGFLHGLHGQIPTEMGILTEMKYLEIQDDYLDGTLPEELGNWTKIEAILLSQNFLSGSIPSTLLDHKLLGTLFLQANKLNGTLDILPTLKNLEWFEGFRNEFTGNLPNDIVQLKKLRILNVNKNTLTGNLPDGWDDENILEDFEVEDNNFDGPLPASLGNVRVLKDLRVSNNSLTGEIPESFYGMENLEELYLDNNNFGGELPQRAELFYDGLQEFSISDNKFNGRFPVELFEDTFRLKKLVLHNNQLSGTISNNICERLNNTNRVWSALLSLTADCQELDCDCCTACWTNGVQDESAV